jgi:hypothetical protein
MNNVYDGCWSNKLDGSNKLDVGIRGKIMPDFCGNSALVADR